MSDESVGKWRRAPYRSCGVRCMGKGERRKKMRVELAMSSIKMFKEFVAHCIT